MNSSALATKTTARLATAVATREILVLSAVQFTTFTNQSSKPLTTVPFAFENEGPFSNQ